MIFTYNKQHVGDVLMVIVQDSKGQDVSFERRGLVSRVFLANSKETVAWNIFEVSTLISLEGQGQIFLSLDDVATLNEVLNQEGFDEKLLADNSPKFVVGEIIAMETHADSDHLNVCQVAIGQDKVLQIVAGAPNAVVGLKTIVALPGAMMPSGSLIFPGQLRGVDSFGMMCSPRELALPNAPQKRGVIELASSVVVGEGFEPGKHWTA